MSWVCREQFAGLVPSGPPLISLSLSLSLSSLSPFSVLPSAAGLVHCHQPPVVDFLHYGSLLLPRAQELFGETEVLLRCVSLYVSVCLFVSLSLSLSHSLLVVVGFPLVSLSLSLSLSRHHSRFCATALLLRAGRPGSSKKKNFEDQKISKCPFASVFMDKNEIPLFLGGEDAGCPF